MSTKKIKVSVTKSDINNGTDCSSSSCPIALALHRKTKYPLRVFEDTIGYGLKDVAKLPKKAITFIERFDFNKGVEPFSFTIELDRKYIKNK